ncbi:MAG: coproporphyrinogen dehydrogenase HemZ [Lachnospiraceae bacterium]|nr:coproporphyrinogen dehydrogenase HemZ [Lachnospiraceae bacterium]
MIDIIIEPADFEYDVQSLVQAFYQGVEFQVNKEKTVNSSEDRAVSCGYTDIVIKVQINTDNFQITFDDGEKKTIDIAECDMSDRREAKNVLKKLLYKILSQKTGKDLPWGNLTGIRPAKIPALLLEQGKDEEYVRKYMKETYLLSEEKMNLALDIAKRENEILGKMPYKEGYSLYVGIPFCPTTCLYCSFTSYPITMYNHITDKYVDTVIKEMNYVGEALKGKVLNTVYIGGGTPTTLSATQLERLIKALKEHFDFENVVEFTVEAGRPDSITKEKLDTLKKMGVDRISINPQTMNQETLDTIGRFHTVEDVVAKFKLARECGFDNINMDLIVGLPGEDEAKVKNTLEQILELNPDSLTVHSLAVKRAARLNIQKEKYENVLMDNNTELMMIAKEYAEKMNMKPYYLYRQKNMAGNQENVGYSRMGCEGIYNILMMGDKQNIVALGAGATTKMMSEDRLSAKRVDNVKNVEIYMERIDEMIERKKNYFENNEFYTK